ncbi:Endoribonuclease L-PSP/chorismate mutase-like protein [Fomitopsis serialis]|uniref:Endoribonuclease L-PSP/chorismate mutase-like protein n=1 Tax=Fomitopsis serialis TaxID=139415 RepID=UPI002008120E|nr:Endoribonuclease L-PSP/chorismate mutase-like protein [Neoantrodia serialis]KAH9936979.1 Endoribonuclease L-PSP/chorismate mutase-like protein [Neoantrodia serialis]
MQSIVRRATAARLPLHKASHSVVYNFNLTAARRASPNFVPTRNMSLSFVSTPDAPPAVGPYAQAVKAGNLLFVSGSLGIDPAIGKLVDGGLEAQTKQALKNLKTIIEAGGATIDKVAKTTVFLADMNDFAAMNAIYAEFFGDHKPSRSTVQVARLPLDGRFEIECIVSLA